MSAKMAAKQGWNADGRFEPFKVFLESEEAERLRNACYWLTRAPLYPTGAEVHLSHAWRMAIGEWLDRMEKAHNKGKPFPAREA